MQKNLNKMSSAQTLDTMTPKDKLYIFIVEDGSCIQNCVNFKVDLLVYLRKYYIEPPKNISQLPPQFLKLDQKFKKQAYRELMELCNEKLGKNEKTFKGFFTINGLLIERLDELTEDDKFLLVSDTP